MKVLHWLYTYKAYAYVCSNCVVAELLLLPSALNLGLQRLLLLSISVSGYSYVRSVPAAATEVVLGLHPYFSGVG
jgi:hypothetical protein